jgi:hypothetical protein
MRFWRSPEQILKLQKGELVKTRHLGKRSCMGVGHLALVALRLQATEEVKVLIEGRSGAITQPMQRPLAIVHNQFYAL